MNKDKLGDEIMSEKELKLFVKNMKNYVATQKNTMTKDEARASLIRACLSGQIYCLICALHPTYSVRIRGKIYSIERKLSDNEKNYKQNNKRF